VTHTRKELADGKRAGPETGEPPGVAPTSRASVPARAEAERITSVAAGIKLKLIPAGEFLMGSDHGEPNERPRHQVRIARSFYLGETEVTQAQYEDVMQTKPSFFSPTGGGNFRIAAGASTAAHPVESVSWADAVLFCNRLSEKEGFKPFYDIDGETATVVSWSGDGYRLPTEAEWEYASGGNPAEMSESAWYILNSGGRTHPVGQKRQNRLGLYDMLGNVSEWCWDVYDEGYYKVSPSEDPRGAERLEFRVHRGGGWSEIVTDCRSVSRRRSSTGIRNRNLGFRVARSQSQR
jgi:formylglycine-generating enzyme required for sulfatase activity